VSCPLFESRALVGIQNMVGSYYIFTGWMNKWWEKIWNGKERTILWRTECTFWRNLCAILNASLVAQMVKNPPVEDLSSFPGLGRPLEKGTITHCSILAWRITWKRSPWKRATVHWVTKIWTWLSDFHSHREQQRPTIRSLLVNFLLFTQIKLVFWVPYVLYWVAN